MVASSLKAAVLGAAAMLLAAVGAAHADPDHFTVHGVPAGEQLNMRAEPGTQARIVARMHNGDPLTNFGCKLVRQTRWCNVKDQFGNVGWASNRFLREAAPTPNRPGPNRPGPNRPGHNAQNALDWPGTYSGVLPCDGCRGIRTTLTLRRNKSFVLDEQFLGAPGRNISIAGNFRFDNRRPNVIRLDGGRAFFVGEGFVEKANPRTLERMGVKRYRLSQH